MADGFEFKDNSEQVKRELQEVIDRALKGAGLIVEAEIKSNVPVITGHLRDSISTKLQGEGDETVAMIGSDKEYAPYVEFGTGEFAEKGDGRKGGWAYKDEKGDWHRTNGMKPTKFMRDGFRTKKATVKSKIESELKGAFGK